ncbi:MAG: ABC transporter substrate-binding protein [Planctomycetia bacterium]
METTAPRIVSLLPAATEIVAALGLRRALVGRSHECDEPADVATLPALTAPRIDAEASSRQIHEQVGRAMNETGGAAALYALDVDALARLEPDLVLTQAACAVCAVAADDVRAAVARSGAAARVLELSPATLDDVYADILAVGAATGTLAKARELVARLRARVRSVACRVQAAQRQGHARQAEACPPDATSAHQGRRPGSAPADGGRPSDGRQDAEPARVAMIEWLDPPMAAGNWVPELVALAGGRDVLGKAGSHSHWITWDDVIAADPDVVVLSPCGFTVDRIVAETETPAIRNRLKMLRAFRAGRVWAMDGHHLLNRPGPRLVDSLEVLAEILHPGMFSFPATQRFARKV